MRKSILTTAVAVGVLTIAIATTAFATSVTRGKVACPNCGSEIEMRMPQGGPRTQRGGMTLDDFKTRMADKVESGLLTQEEADTRIAEFEERQASRPEIGERRAAMTLDEYKAKLTEKVESGEITQEEADARIAECEEREAERTAKLEEFKAKLAQDVADGKITQEQADKMINGGMRGSKGMGKGMMGKRAMGKAPGARIAPAQSETTTEPLS